MHVNYPILDLFTNKITVRNDFKIYSAKIPGNITHAKYVVAAVRIILQVPSKNNLVKWQQQGLYYKFLLKTIW